MKNKHPYISVILIVLVLLSTLCFPVFAYEEAIATHCHRCGSQSIFYYSQHDDWVTVIRTCPLTNPGIAHEHYMHYMYNDYLCDDCGYVTSVVDYTIQQLCEFGNYK